MSEQKPVYASAARTATPATATFNMGYDTALTLVVDVTAIAATPQITVTVDVFDVLSAKWVNVLTMAAITTVSTTKSTLVQGLSGSVRVISTHLDADSITYSISAHTSGR